MRKFILSTLVILYTLPSMPLSNNKAILNSNRQVPSFKNYNGPLFKINDDYPEQPTPKTAATPWRNAIDNKLINIDNAEKYTLALKQSISKDMQVLLFDYPNWDAHKFGWYNEPWLESLREPIHGMYVGNDLLDKSLFVGSNLKNNITTYVLTYYDKKSANSLFHVWGKSKLKPNITSQSTQFAEGSIIVKIAFITADEKIWPVMQGAQIWPLYISLNATKGTGSKSSPKLTNTYFMQFDIIIKDSKSAPKTGWIFTTLVYDYRIKGKNIWNKMIPLGTQWGNDPEINSALYPNAKLTETWLNPQAPKYATMTLGWGGRLSGPNDGAVNNIVYKENGKNIYKRNAQNSSCMSCHGAAQWDPKNPEIGMQSAHLPSLTSNLIMERKDKKNYIISPAPGSKVWKRWFQNRFGDTPQNKESIAFDYDMVFAFISLPAWFTTISGKKHRLYNDSFEENAP